MAREKQYTGTTADFERKLTRVMERLGVEQYDYNWQQSKGMSSCFVEMRYGARAYRFTNDTDKSRECGRNLTYVSDLFGEIVYSLEGLARAVEKGIFTLDMLLAGVPALPEAVTLEPCFAALGFDRRPENAEEVKKQYHRMAKAMHPDAGGDAEAFDALQKNYEACLDMMEVKG